MLEVTSQKALKGFFKTLISSATQDRSVVSKMCIRLGLKAKTLKREVGVASEYSIISMLIIEQFTPYT